LGVKDLADLEPDSGQMLGQDGARGSSISCFARVQDAVVLVRRPSGRARADVKTSIPLGMIEHLSQDDVETFSCVLCQATMKVAVRHGPATIILLHRVVVHFRHAALDTGNVRRS
jgi:hypothetical protein